MYAVTALLRESGWNWGFQLPEDRMRLVVVPAVWGEKQDGIEQWHASWWYQGNSERLHWISSVVWMKPKCYFTFWFICSFNFCKSALTFMVSFWESVAIDLFSNLGMRTCWVSSLYLSSNSWHSVLAFHNYQVLLFYKNKEFRNASLPVSEESWKVESGQRFSKGYKNLNTIH